MRYLKRDLEKHKAYDIIMQEQVQNKKIERISSNEISSCKEFYRPGKCGPKKVEQTKLLVFYYASVKSETGF